jgi:hypothetical protein
MSESVVKSCKGKLIIVKFELSTPNTSESEKVKKKSNLFSFFGGEVIAPLAPALATAIKEKSQG